MLLSITILSILSTFILNKTRSISIRNNLNAKSEKRLVISSVLIIIFLITNLTLPYPKSLYWFIGLGVIFTVSVLSFDILGSEYKRFKTLEFKDKVVNFLFYSLLFAVTNIYL